MNVMKKLTTLTAVMALFSGQIQAQEVYCDDSCAAYCDSNQATTMSALIPLGALAIAAILIATTDRHHHHGSSCCNNSSNSSSCSSHSHSHF